MIFKGRIVDIVHNILKEYVNESGVVIDGTVGNGNDTILLAELVGEKGMVYGFDIQQKAILNTKEKLQKNNLEDRVKLILDSHSKIEEYIKEEIDGAVFNLGFLPGSDSDKTIITKSDTTLKAIESCLRLLKKKGIVIITSYYGHEGGLEEKNAVEKYIRELDNRMFKVIKLDFINKINNPPIIYVINKTYS